MRHAELPKRFPKHFLKSACSIICKIQSVQQILVNNISQSICYTGKLSATLKNIVSADKMLLQSLEQFLLFKRYSISNSCHPSLCDIFVPICYCCTSATKIPLQLHCQLLVALKASMHVFFSFCFSPIFANKNICTFGMLRQLFHCCNSFS